jgi:hypothetical protein
MTGRSPICAACWRITRAADAKGHANQDGMIVGFQASEAGNHDIIAFLHSLTDETFLTSPALPPHGSTITPPGSTGPTYKDPMKKGQT